MTRAVLLDLDLDFLVDGTGSLREEPDKPLWCPATRLHEALVGAGLVPAPVEAFLDQQQALAVWDRLGVRGAIAIHVDAHRDVYAAQSNAMARPLGIRGRHVSCGDYLYHALREQIVGEVVQIVPDPQQLDRAALDVRRSCPDAIADRISLARLADLARAVEALDAVGPALIVTVAVSPAWLPRTAWAEAQRLLEQLGVPADVRSRLHGEAERRWCAVTEGTPWTEYQFPYERVP